MTLLPDPPALRALRARAAAAKAVDARLLALGPALDQADVRAEAEWAAEQLTRPLEGIARAEAVGRFGAWSRELRRRQQGTALWTLAASGPGCPAGAGRRPFRPACPSRISASPNARKEVR